jgi:hypothetical protein
LLGLSQSVIYAEKIISFASSHLQSETLESKHTESYSSFGSQKMTPPAEPFTIASVAKNLAELKALSTAEKGMALLRRLAHLYPQVRGTGGLHKGNLLLPNDPYALAYGFPANENMSIREYLLGVPWTRLVNEGFLVDPSGSGFYLLSDEGVEAVKKATESQPSSARPDEVTRIPDSAPTAFISYSWDGAEHQDWVLRLAERLQSEGGVRVILDRWDLHPGGDRTHFMEESVVSSDFVLVICTPSYATKSKTRSGGVGYEAMIITGQLALQILQTKFIPILRAGKWDNSAVPAWILTKIGVDLRGDPYDEVQYELLLRTLHQAHLKPPPIGSKPVFSDGSKPGISNSVGNAVSAVLDVVKTGSGNVDEGTGGGSAGAPKQPPVAYAWYTTKGPNSQRVEVYVRPTDESWQTFMLESSSGEVFQGSQTEIAQRYLAFDFELKQKGFTHTNVFTGAIQIFKLP